MLASLLLGNAPHQLYNPMQLQHLHWTVVAALKSLKRLLCLAPETNALSAT